MRAYSVYIETSVVSYLTAKLSHNLIVASHQKITHDWWDNELPKLEPFISPIVIEEASKGDPSAADLRLHRMKTFQILETTKEAHDLASRYFGKINLPEKARADAYHISVATVHGMDFLVSWNCKHIVNAHIRLAVEEVNADYGYRTPIICTPEELTEA